MKTTFRKLFAILTLIVVLTDPHSAWSQEVATPPAELKLARAVMCESIQKLAPANQAVLFSIDVGRISCFTEFEQVTKQTFIRHKWYRKGNLISVKQLTVHPPRWSSFSSMQLRNADKGPWRVDVTDENDNLIVTLRFSITE